MPAFECPTCQKTVKVDLPQDLPHRPFCSDRCRLVDLGKWLDGSYKTSQPATADDFENEEQ